MGFGNYLHELLPRFLKGDEIRKWIDAFGASQDDLKQATFNLRRAWVLATATGEALDPHGKDRGLPRYPGESDDLYRRRLMAAFGIYAQGGTNPGLQEALRLIGYPAAEIYELFRDGYVAPLRGGQNRYDAAARHTGGVRWAEFKVISGIEDDRPFTAADLAVLMDTVNRVKASHTMMAAFVLAPQLRDQFPLAEGLDTRARWLRTDGVAGPILEHATGLGAHSARHDGQHRYGSGNVLDKLALDMRLSVGTDRLPGLATYAPAFRHDAGGSRWNHAGSMLRRPFYRFSDRLARNGAFVRGLTLAHYGDRLLGRSGLIRYGAGLARNGTATRGAAGIAEGFRLVVRRRGQVVEIAA